jgi:hypothetical protein
MSKKHRFRKSNQKLNTQVNKAQMAISADSYLSSTSLPQNDPNKNRRGLQVYYFSQLQNIAGMDKQGNFITGTVDRPLFTLTVEDRVDIFKRCSDVFGIVTTRMNKISSLDWNIVKKSKVEDRLAEQLKNYNQLFLEYHDPNNLAYMTFCRQLWQMANKVLFDIKPDFSNFQGSLLRWKRNLKNRNQDQSQEIEDWLHRPNAQDTFQDYIKKYVFDLMIHGAFSPYKEYVDGKLENIYALPGGSVYPLMSRYASAGRAFVQMIQGQDAKIYFEDELSFSVYVPNSGCCYGNLPLEALVNKVAESLLWDQLCAERADGTRPPEKAVVFGGQMPFGELTNAENYQIPLPAEEQKRIETVLNEPRKNAIRTLTGTGTPMILDLSKTDTFQQQQERQRVIRESVALVFNMTNAEANLTGSDSTSGRATSESQERIEREKGIYPIVQIIENDFNFNILPFRFGSDFLLEFKTGLSDKEQIDIESAKMQTGTYSVNEIRGLRGDDPVNGEEFDKPAGQVTKQQPDGSEKSPFSVQNLEQ